MYNGLGGVGSIRPSPRSLPAALDLEDEEEAPGVCACVLVYACARAKAALAKGTRDNMQSVRTLSQCLATEDCELVCAPAFGAD